MRCSDWRSIAVIGRAEAGDAATTAAEAARRREILVITHA
jgi:hypothetical protein